jgi:Recombinase
VGWRLGYCRQASAGPVQVRPEPDRGRGGEQCVGMGLTLRPKTTLSSSTARHAPIDPANEAHDMIMSTFGSLSKGERNRIKIRVRAAMSAQAQMEGRRYLGGRPPYGYLLIDAGPHPNPAKAADGKRLHVLGIDEPAAVVRRIFAEFLAGFGIYAIAERLTAEGIPARPRTTQTATGTAAGSPGVSTQFAPSS